MLWFVRAVLLRNLSLTADVAVGVVVVWQAGWLVSVADRFRALASGEDVLAVLAVGSLVLAVWSGVASHEEKIVEPWDDAKFS